MQKFKSEILKNEYSKQIGMNLKYSFILKVLIILIAICLILSFLFNEVFLGICFLFVIILVIIALGQKRIKERLNVINQMSQDELDKVSYEVESNKLITTEFLVLTNSYIINLAKFEIIKYTDIEWAYFIKTFYCGVINVGTNLVFWTKDGTFHELPELEKGNKKKKAEISQKILEIIQSKSNELIIGYSSENQSLYNKRIGK